MFSIICVYNNEEMLNSFLLSTLSKQNTEYDLVLVENKDNKFTSAASALNYGAKNAKGDYLIFVHQDIKLIGEDWLLKTEKLIKNLDNVGSVGVFGKKDVHNYTNILMGNPPSKLSEYTLSEPMEIKTLDECLIIVPKDVFKKCSFDENVCNHWHLYGTDLVLSLKKLGYKNYVIPTDLIHNSTGDSFSQEYFGTMKKLQRKHYKEKLIYTSCGDWFTFIPMSLQRITKVIIYLVLMYVFKKIDKKDGWIYVHDLYPFNKN